jgi:sugar O-acyltransferase (sialic acid O-acetyltransferase NeuD family)
MISRDKIILIGGGGHCNSVIDIIEQENKFEIAGIVDRAEMIGKKTLNYEIIAEDLDLPKLVKEFKYFFITVGHIRSNQLRIKLYETVVFLGGKFPVIVSPLAHVSKHARVLDGTVIMHKATVNPNSFIEQNSIINTGSIIEHGVKVGKHCHISTGAVVNGDCCIKDNCFVGSGSVLVNGITIHENTLVGAGSVVIKDVRPFSKIVGNPAKLMDE